MIWVPLAFVLGCMFGVWFGARVVAGYRRMLDDRLRQTSEMVGWLSSTTHDHRVYPSVLTDAIDTLRSDLTGFGRR